MRPVFAIAPLALAFILLGPTEANSAATPSLIAKVWHMVFDRDVASPTGQANGDPLNETAAPAAR